MNPELLNRYLYAEKTPTWYVRIAYFIGLLVWIPVLWAAIDFSSGRLIYTGIFLLIILFLSAHYFVSFGLNLFYKQFDVEEHKRFRKYFWSKSQEPSIDVFLPICGEDISVLENTWHYVSRLDYKNYQVFVLDDSKEEIEEHKKLAARYGFNYIERPNKGEMKKAGNLKYAFERTNGDFIAIFDADFAPHPEYLRDLLPYTNDIKVGIVQSPQYFPTTKEVHANGPLAYGGARAQEIFYRIIQVARDRLGGAHCCGTCAIYRREALDSIGGFVQIGHSEDAHTGYTLTANHWIVRYIPLIVSVGISPNDPHAFFHQQHRWCLGNTMMMMDKKFWLAPIPLRIKFCYITGFFFYIHQPLLLIFPFQLFIVLFLYQDQINLMDGLWFYPHIIWAFGFMFFFYLSPFRWGYLYAIMLRMYAYCHATFTEIMGGTVGWIPTNSKHYGVSRAFRGTVIWTSIYFFAYLICIALATRMSLFKWSDIDYIVVEFWIVFNVVVIGTVLWKLYGVMLKAQQERVKIGHIQNHHFKRWQLQTAGSYLLFSSLCFSVVAGIPLGSSFKGLFIVPGDTPTMLANVSTAVKSQTDEAVVDHPAKGRIVLIATTSDEISRGFAFTQDFGIGSESNDVQKLQEYLNTNGYALTESGDGSIGQETTYFGDLTRAALMKFQKDNDLEETGYMDNNTRDKINSLHN